MKNTDKITMTYGQLTKLIKEAKYDTGFIDKEYNPEKFKTKKIQRREIAATALNKFENFIDFQKKFKTEFIDELTEMFKSTNVQWYGHKPLESAKELFDHLMYMLSIGKYYKVNEDELFEYLERYDKDEDPMGVRANP